ncbi:14886_t:CDS:2 [Entrophospora sp. SA101]|nr:14719_t:CDS:2 [Entrophospora sp. SA101]CAJ0849428.1 14886_t:CDS:2 [Entrophospora sp. SA101]
MDGYWYGHEESYDYVYMTHEVSGIVSLDSKLIGFGILSVGGVDGGISIQKLKVHG